PNQVIMEQLVEDTIHPPDLPPRLSHCNGHTRVGVGIGASRPRFAVTLRFCGRSQTGGLGTHPIILQYLPRDCIWEYDIFSSCRAALARSPPGIPALILASTGP